MQKVRQDRRPLHVQTYQLLLEMIENGTYEPGEQLPAEADLAAQLGISRPTLREALHNLEQEGVIIRKHGVGTFVATQNGSRLDSGLERLESVLQLAARQGMTVTMRGLRVEQLPADETLAKNLELSPGTPVTCVSRTIVVKDRPAAYLIDYCPTTILPAETLDPPFTGSVLDLLAQQTNLHVYEALAEITALDAGEHLAGHLGVQPGAALLLLTETLFADDQTPIGFSRNYFLPDLFTFHVLRR